MKRRLFCYIEILRISAMKKNKIRITLSVIVIVIATSWLLTPQYLRIALLHQQPDIDDYTIFSNRTIAASHNPTQWNLATHYNKKTISAQLRDSIEKYNTVAYLIIRNDSILYEEYWDDYGTESLSNSFSMAKTVVAMLVGCAIDDGVIGSLDDKAVKYLPNLSGAFAQELTIKNLLNMSSGSSWDESYSSPTSITTKAYYGKDIDAVMEKISIDSETGKTFNYKSGDTQLLAMIIEKVCGKRISDYASEKIWQKIGAEHDALWSLDADNGMEKAYCCFNSNARDFARLGRLILHDGEAYGTRVISHDYINNLKTPALHLTDSKGNNVDYYGYQTWILHHRNLTMPTLRGILGQYIITIPEYNAIVVRLGHKRSEAKHNNFTTEIYCYVDAAMEILN